MCDMQMVAAGPQAQLDIPQQCRLAVEYQAADAQRLQVDTQRQPHIRQVDILARLVRAVVLSGLDVDATDRKQINT